MAADHFAMLVERYRRGRSDRQIWQAADIPADWLTRPLKPSTRVRTMPEENRLAVLARAIGAPLAEVRNAFAADVGQVPLGGALEPDNDPNTAKMARLWEQLDTPHRVTGIAMLQSLATLQRRTTAIDAHDTREVG